MTRGNSRKPGTGVDRPPHTERWGSDRPEELRPVRLIRKYAAMIDGVDLEDAVVGDRLELSQRDADVLIAEGWAVADQQRRVRTLPGRAHAADRARSPRKKPGN
jgi:hypothetical protein